KVIFTSGKLYHELLTERTKRSCEHSVALVRVEEYCPFPWEEVKREVEKYNKEGVQWVWAQEEHLNGGAWGHVQPRLNQLLPEECRKKGGVVYVGRGPAAAPANGIYSMHTKEQTQIYEDAFAGVGGGPETNDAAFGRTGTASLYESLKLLGFTCYHMKEISRLNLPTQPWLDASNGIDVDWGQVFEPYGYDAAVNWPVCTFYKSILKRYPGAKVVLTKRDPEKWYESVRKTIYEFDKVETEDPVHKRILEMHKKIVWDGTFSGRFEDKSHAIDVYNAHIQDVISTVPPAQLLVFHVSEGWDPLCEFLGVEKPDVPFPHANEASEMIRRLKEGGVFKGT
ncbi:hypothetical protein HK104_004489, partial [Borealophlyctis nickersoniae]